MNRLGGTRLYSRLHSLYMLQDFEIASLILVRGACNSAQQRYVANYYPSSIQLVSWSLSTSGPSVPTVHPPH